MPDGSATSCGREYAKVEQRKIAGSYLYLKPDARRCPSLQRCLLADKLSLVPAPDEREQR